jgi:HEPN domain-containing protein
MTPPLFPLHESLEWLAIAARDLRLAELALADQPPLAGEALYHAQQAAEKALKGFLVFSGVPYLLTHDLRRLLEQCAEFDRTLADSLEAAAGLTQFSVRFRYSGEEQPNREEAVPWLKLG